MDPISELNNSPRRAALSEEQEIAAIAAQIFANMNVEAAFEPQTNITKQGALKNLIDKSFEASEAFYHRVRARRISVYQAFE